MSPGTTTVLLTGFEPFGGENVNPSQKIAEALANRRIGKAIVRSAILPCVFGRAASVLLDRVSADSPRVVLCLGQAGGREGVHLERVALNLDDARLPDNAGKQPHDQPIAPDGPAAYWSTLPIRAIVERLARRQVPVTASLSAGTFVCNHVFYALMHALAAQPPSASGVWSAGFVHVPWLPEQPGALRGEPSLSLETQVTAVEWVIETALAIWAGSSYAEEETLGL